MPCGLLPSTIKIQRTGCQVKWHEEAGGASPQSVGFLHEVKATRIVC